MLLKIVLFLGKPFVHGCVAVYVVVYLECSFIPKRMACFCCPNTVIWICQCGDLCKLTECDSCHQLLFKWVGSGLAILILLLI